MVRQFLDVLYLVELIGERRGRVEGEEAVEYLHEGVGRIVEDEVVDDYEGKSAGRS